MKFDYGRRVLCDVSWCYVLFRVFWFVVCCFLFVRRCVWLVVVRRVSCVGCCWWLLLVVCCVLVCAVRGLPLFGCPWLSIVVGVCCLVRVGRWSFSVFIVCCPLLFELLLSVI